eukprot:g14572.t1
MSLLLAAQASPVAHTGQNVAHWGPASAPMSSDTNKLLTEWKACKEWAQQDKVQNVLKFYYEMPTSNQISWNIPGTDWRKFLSPKGKYFYVNAVTRAICWDIQEYQQIQRKGLKGQTRR